jgi:hypothetical protein
MSELSPEEYPETLKESHHRNFSADALSWELNKPTIKKIKVLFESHAIGIRLEENRFTFPFFVFALSSSEASKPTLICEKAIQRSNRRGDGASSRSCARVL